MAKPSSADRRGGGGNATASGILYQAGIGALFSARLLTEASLEDIFGLADARIKSIRFETNAPVDDILLETDRGGFVAIQAKATITLGTARHSPLGSVADQFARHWIVATEGEGSEHWARALDPERDRLVLAFGPGSTANVAKLAGSIGAVRPDGPAGEIRDTFENLLSEAFAANGRPADAGTIAALLQMIRIVELDPAEGDRRVAVEQLVPLLGSREDANSGFEALTMICTEQMKRRGGFDGALLRTELTRRGIATGPAPTFARSIAALQAYSNKTIDQLAAYEKLAPKTGDAFTLQRDCMPDVSTAARGGSLILTGEPGSGKSGVLNSLARSLASDGNPVVTLAVDRLPVATLNELSDRLNLDRPLPEVLANWPGNDVGYLVIDALDATRGGPAESVFKALIADTLGLPGGRWRVIASIRSFDLRLGRQFRELFKGTPPNQVLADPAFKMVRHVSVPEWTDREFAEILERSPDIGIAIERSGSSLAALARVPFNTRLLADMMSRGTPPESFDGIATQAALLAYFWQERVEGHGSGAELCLRRTIDYMIVTGSLRAPALEVAAKTSSADLDQMEHEGVLVRQNGGRHLAFRHHILFDFAASRLLLNPTDPQELALTLVGPAALALAPALGFVLGEAWANDNAHSDFWRVALVVAGDKTADPIARSVVARQAAELPMASDDTNLLVEAMKTPSTREAALRVLRNLLGALSVRNDDGLPVPLAPWLTVAHRLPDLIVGGWTDAIGPFRVLLHILLAQKDPVASDRQKLGTAARALMAIALEDPSAVPTTAISFVAATYDTNVESSRAALAPLLTLERLSVHAATDAPALASEIGQISTYDPDFASEIYKKLFDFEVTDETTSRLGNSQILPLTSTLRQDYSIACHQLAEAYPAFLEANPEHAVSAMIEAMNAQVRRETNGDLAKVEKVETKLGPLPLIRDRSHIWAWDIEDRHASDAEKMLQATVSFLCKALAEVALTIAEVFLKKAQLGVLWSRFLHASAVRPDLLGDLAWPVASAGGFLIAIETSKDAIDAVLAILPSRTHEERVDFETALLKLDFSAFGDPAAAHNLLLRKTLGALGRDAVVTDAGREWIEALGNEAGPVENARPFSIKTGFREGSSLLEDAGLDEDDKAGAALFREVTAVQERQGPIGDAIDVDISAILLADVEKLCATIDGSEVTAPSAIASASAPVIKAAHALAANSGNALKDVPDGVNRLAGLVEWLAKQIAPIADNGTEDEFAEFQSWGAPAPRVDAADLAFDLLLIDPGLVGRILPLIDAALVDTHPAVRMMAAQHLTSLWLVDREVMWSRVTRVAQEEQNPGVLRFFASQVLRRLISEADTLEPIVLSLATRAFPQNSVGRGVEDHLAELITALWLLRGCEDSHSWIGRQLKADFVRSSDFLSEAAGVAGQLLWQGYADGEREAVRRRAQALMEVIVDRAADELDSQLTAVTDERNQPLIDSSVALLDRVVRQIRTAAEALRNSEEGAVPSRTLARARFLDDLAPMLTRIGDVAPPRALHDMVEALDFLLDGNPERCFELIAHGVLTAGRKFGYQYESLGVGRIVNIVGRALADHRGIFQDEKRRGQLIEMLEMFVDQGWPQARRLVYELPELFR